jgi:hypothetical protein
MSKKVSKKTNWFKGNNFTSKDEIYVGVDVHKPIDKAIVMDGERVAGP